MLDFPMGRWYIISELLSTQGGTRHCGADGGGHGVVIRGIWAHGKVFAHKFSYFTSELILA